MDPRCVPYCPSFEPCRSQSSHKRPIIISPYPWLIISLPFPQRPRDPANQPYASPNMPLLVPVLSINAIDPSFSVPSR
uniref:Uncharacterized protein n=1 Tax=Picea glauca TaxID=3330 RepID=A0A101M550_PICGL|nr:hypothetical protein ABT39_MTgene1009 [Picea glauca]QHR87334.1 hypothetical protein Q903MT_gene1344 [Picea sitchensis]